MPAAIAIPAMIGAGTSIAGGVMSSKASKNAAKTQQQAGERALREQRMIYEDQRNLMSPWITAGQSAAGTLGQLLTPGPNARFAAPALPQLPPLFGGGGSAMPRQPGFGGPNLMAQPQRQPMGLMAPPQQFLR